MIKIKLPIGILVIILISSALNSLKLKSQSLHNNDLKFIPSARILSERFGTPEKYIREPKSDSSFATFLRNLPLKHDGSKVKYYDGDEKEKTGVYVAVVDLNIGNQNLHQCADAVIRLRAEYLYSVGKYDEIIFHFTNGFPAKYSEWMKGNRIAVNGNDVRWVKKTEPSNSYPDFWNYLEVVFTYAGTISLEKELVPVSLKNMQIGDVFIQGGSPGHAVIVVDMALNQVTGKKVFMVAQSYMPAQEIQILQNPSDERINPWYELEFGNKLLTPEWIFSKNDLKRFK